MATEASRLMTEPMIKRYLIYRTPTNKPDSVDKNRQLGHIKKVILVGVDQW